MKKVSILIPCYNSEKWVGETLDCCLRQTYPNIEIILVDDGSTDNSLAIARDYERKDERIHVFSQPNSGGCRARNLAFEKSTGDYIKYLDADDLMSDDMIEMQMRILNGIDDPYAISTCAYEDFHTTIEDVTFKKRFLYKDYSNGLDLIEDAWYNGGWFVVTCYLTSRRLIREAGPWNEKLTKIQDGEFFCRVLTKAHKISFCKEAKFYYRRGHLSVSTTNKYDIAKLQSSLDGRISCVNTVLLLRNTPQIRRGVARIFSEVMLNAPFGSSYYTEAKRHIIELGESPFHPCPSKKVALVEKVIGFNILLFIKFMFIKLHLKS
ncbi:glycosyltransferase family 2 protein [Bacteroides hominis]|jgi:glycosyltransferase involved in cell wall biosynthesis|uniref:glycosyltransferase family 2 protein n=1 Tax=Bacteroides hominis TaxID=2763023 RepID=UPI00294911F6|nr:glycosyltransferase family 2 protein [Bacteroides hominis (ex Liu et al. 2022)]MDV6173734.1 glycosyltransferase family 2 protein [Bacteroides hominis (ex Liu et al. 2022)]